MNVAGMYATKNVFFRQLFDPGSNSYTYILGDRVTGEAGIIDPVLQQAERDIQILKQCKLSLTQILSTHVHSDHVTGIPLLKSVYPDAVAVIGHIAKPAYGERYVKSGDVISLGSIKLQVRETPGHTSGCVSYVMAGEKTCFCGDTILVRSCGRTDFQGGNPETLYNSVHNQIYNLPEDCILYPAHDYRGQTATTVQEEKEHNKRISTSVSKKDFITNMNNLSLPYPTNMDVSIPANTAWNKLKLTDLASP
eukprot:GFYU01029744.1.p1 GENE.GFYU01029744.1~~GFYU01029744.1.p1  ORF type:complete len:251 (-),score=24.14 GFYU01029744.1:129-881(-)